MSGTLLSLRGVDAGYGAFRTLFDVSLEVAEGSVTAVLGPNGAGKTTLARVASGLVHPTAGSVVFDGADVTRTRPSRLARRGLVHLVEGRSVFASLTVDENLRLVFGAVPPADAAADGVAAALERAYEAFPHLGERRRQQAGTLSGGEQRMLGLARVLGRPPRLLVADELSLGLAPMVVAEVYAALARIRELGTTLVVIEQHVHRALELADEVVLLSKGRVVHAGPASEARGEIDALLPGVVTAPGR